MMAITFTLGLTFLLLQQLQAQTCPSSDWISFNDVCYLFQHDESRIWHDAKRDCESYTNLEGTGTLAAVTSAEVNDFMRENAVLPNSYLIGLKVMEKYHDPTSGCNTTCMWWTSGDEVEYTNWAPNQPDNAAGVQYCGVLWDTHDYAWDDNSCEDLSDPYICQWKRSAVTCPSTDWIAYKDSCYLFAYNVSETPDESREICRSYTSDDGVATLASVPDAGTRNFMLSHTESQGLHRLFVGGQLKGSFCPSPNCYYWDNGDPLIFTDWREGEPNNSGGNENCIELRLQTGGDWNDIRYNYSSTSMGYVCQWRPMGYNLGPPQYHVQNSGVFNSTDGSSFTPVCSEAYAVSFSQTSNQMVVQVNDLIGGELCSGKTREEVQVLSVQTTLGTSANMGSAQNTFLLEVGHKQTIESAETCAQEISVYLRDHVHWPTPILPPQSGCPDAAFNANTFEVKMTEWLCLDSVGEDKAVQGSLAPGLVFKMSIRSDFITDTGEDLSLDCLNTYGTEMTQQTYDIITQINPLINTDLCVNLPSMPIITGTSYLSAAGNASGAVAVNFFADPNASMYFQDVYTCARELSAYLLQYSNWGLPVLPAQPGCPLLLFQGDNFSETDQSWNCDATA